MHRLEKEIDFFKRYRPDFFKRYPGRYLVIEGGQVVGVFDKARSAVLKTSNANAPDTFLVQHCVAVDIF
ncbi:hypothetical protein ACFLZM_05920 [Thermodesulfobacteriota bacterium]